MMGSVSIPCHWFEMGVGLCMTYKILVLRFLSFLADAYSGCSFRIDVGLFMIRREVEIFLIIRDVWRTGLGKWYLSRRGMAGWGNSP